ncbi:MAG: hypothetical protein P4L44_15005 [Oryzomonas sp.]|uniref:hypothetical protein n=1 Tax=Oryzomonas sp. TaxID=2855186 RepID=UPI00283B83C2|nr:hypothetical protein [Oryzomonas sp.]MDR3581269.1 hypothetical protein [Oryzomonas sp.]
MRIGLAADTLRPDGEEMNERHHQVFDAYDERKLILDEYLEGWYFMSRAIPPVMNSVSGVGTDPAVMTGREPKEGKKCNWE